MFLHVDFGRRRRGDLQRYIDKEMENVHYFDLIVVSLDLVVNGRWGDVSSPATQSFWLDCIRMGLVVAMAIGPPCKTWSRVQNVHSSEGVAQGPRVLRRPDCPWGLASFARNVPTFYGQHFVGLWLPCICWPAGVILRLNILVNQKNKIL